MAGIGVELRRKIVAFILVFVVVAMGIGLNFTAMQYEDRALALHTVISILYALFWLMFTYTTRNNRSLQMLSFVVGTITFLTALISIIVRFFGTGELYSFTTSLLSVSFVTPLFGLQVFGDYLLVALFISMVWSGIAVYNIVRTDEANFFNQISKKEDVNLSTKRKGLPVAFVVALAYAIIYFISQKCLYFIYTPEWTSRSFLPIAAIISLIPALRKARCFPYISLSGYVIGVIIGELFGRTERIMDKRLPPMPVHNGWFIAIVTFLIFCLIGAVLEVVSKKKREAKAFLKDSTVDTSD